MLHKLVVVKWEDSARPAPEWRFVADLEDPEVIECLSVGWVVQETEKVIALAPNLGDVGSGGSGQACGVIRIPRSCIVQITPMVDPT